MCLFEWKLQIYNMFITWKYFELFARCVFFGECVNEENNKVTFKNNLLDLSRVNNGITKLVA